MSHNNPIQPNTRLPHNNNNNHNYPQPPQPQTHGFNPIITSHSPTASAGSSSLSDDHQSVETVLGYTEGDGGGSANPFLNSHPDHQPHHHQGASGASHKKSNMVPADLFMRRTTQREVIFFSQHDPISPDDPNLEDDFSRMSMASGQISVPALSQSGLARGNSTFVHQSHHQHHQQQQQHNHHHHPHNITNDIGSPNPLSYYNNNYHHPQPQHYQPHTDPSTNYTPHSANELTDGQSTPKLKSIPRYSQPHTHNPFQQATPTPSYPSDDPGHSGGSSQNSPHQPTSASLYTTSRPIYPARSTSNLSHHVGDEECGGGFMSKYRDENQSGESNPSNPHSYQHHPIGDGGGGNSSHQPDGHSSYHQSQSQYNQQSSSFSTRSLDSPMHGDGDNGSEGYNHHTTTNNNINNNKNVTTSNNTTTHPHRRHQLFTNPSNFTPNFLQANSSSTTTRPDMNRTPMGGVVDNNGNANPDLPDFHPFDYDPYSRQGSDHPQDSHHPVRDVRSGVLEGREGRGSSFSHSSNPSQDLRNCTHRSFALPKRDYGLDPGGFGFSSSTGVGITGQRGQTPSSTANSTNPDITTSTNMNSRLPLPQYDDHADGDGSLTELIVPSTSGAFRNEDSHSAAIDYALFREDCGQTGSPGRQGKSKDTCSTLSPDSYNQHMAEVLSSSGKDTAVLMFNKKRVIGGGGQGKDGQATTTMTTTTTSPGGKGNGQNGQNGSQSGHVTPNRSPFLGSSQPTMVIRQSTSSNTSANSFHHHDNDLNKLESMISHHHPQPTPPTHRATQANPSNPAQSPPFNTPTSALTLSTQSSLSYTSRQASLTNDTRSENDEGNYHSHNGHPGGMGEEEEDQLPLGLTSSSNNNNNNNNNNNPQSATSPQMPNASTLPPEWAQYIMHLETLDDHQAFQHIQQASLLLKGSNDQELDKFSPPLPPPLHLHQCNGSNSNSAHRGPFIPIHLGQVGDQPNVVVGSNRPHSNAMLPTPFTPTPSTITTEPTPIDFVNSNNHSRSTSNTTHLTPQQLTPQQLSSSISQASNNQQYQQQQQHSHHHHHHHHHASASTALQNSHPHSRTQSTATPGKRRQGTIILQALSTLAYSINERLSLTSAQAPRGVFSPGYPTPNNEINSEYGTDLSVQNRSGMGYGIPQPQLTPNLSGVIEPHSNHHSTTTSHGGTGMGDLGKLFGGNSQANGHLHGGHNNNHHTGHSAHRHHNPITNHRSTSTATPSLTQPRPPGPGGHGQQQHQHSYPHQSNNHHHQTNLQAEQPSIYPGSAKLLFGQTPQGVLIIKKPGQGPQIQALRDVANFLREKGVTVYIERAVYDSPEFSDLTPMNPTNPGHGIDFGITLGGDGTVLHYNHIFNSNNKTIPPVICFSLGTLGFLAPFAFSTYKQVLELTLNAHEKYVYCCTRTRLQCNVFRKGEFARTYSQVLRDDSNIHLRQMSKQQVEVTPNMGDRQSVGLGGVGRNGAAGYGTAGGAPQVSLAGSNQSGSNNNSNNHTPTQVTPPQPGTCGTPTPSQNFNNHLNMSSVAQRFRSRQNQLVAESMKLVNQNQQSQVQNGLPSTDLTSNNNNNTHSTLTTTTAATATTITAPNTTTQQPFSPLSFYPLNEVVIQRALSSMASIQLFVDGHFVTTISADGVIIATPTGSSGYGMAAGGPMVAPSTPALIIVPICPHNLAFRPVVVCDSTLIRLRVTNTMDPSTPLIASFDGRNHIELFPGDSIQVRTSKIKVPTIVFSEFNTDWFESIKYKLNWNATPDYMNAGGAGAVSKARANGNNSNIGEAGGTF